MKNLRTNTVWAAVVVVSLLTANTFAGENVPTAGDAERLAKEAESVSSRFLAESLELRLKYYLEPQLLSGDEKEVLKGIAERAAGQLEQIGDRQRELKEKIENYEGDDWDERFGQTGLWRRVFSDEQKTSLLKCQAEFFPSRCAEKIERLKVLSGVLAKIDAVEENFSSPSIQLLKAEVFAELARTHPGYKDAAEGQLELILKNEDVERDVYFKAVLLKMKSSGKVAASELNEITEQLDKSGGGGDFELRAKVYLLRRKFGFDDGLAEIVDKWPESEAIIGGVILAELNRKCERGGSLDSVSSLEAQLAATAAIERGGKFYGKVLNALAEAGYLQSSLLFYAAGLANEDSNPADSVKLFMAVVKNPQELADVVPDRKSIAEYAANIAYNLFADDDRHARLACEAIETYLSLCGENCDEQLEYFGATVFEYLGQSEKANLLLKKIAAEKNNDFADRAKLDLIIRRMQSEEEIGRDEKAQILGELESLRSKAADDNRIVVEATVIYCELLLDGGGESEAREALEILSRSGLGDNNLIVVMQGRALQKLGQLPETVKLLRQVIEVSDCRYAQVAIGPVEKIVEQIERYESKDDFKEILQNCISLSGYSYNCSSGNEKVVTGVMLVELNLLAGLENSKELLEMIAEQVDSGDIGLLRCRGRLLAAHQKYSQAAKLWVRIGQSVRNFDQAGGERSWQWWRAKFYELYCWSKIPQTWQADVVHTINILENSFPRIPSPWGKRIAELKRAAEADN